MHLLDVPGRVTCRIIIAPVHTASNILPISVSSNLINILALRKFIPYGDTELIRKCKSKYDNQSVLTAADELHYYYY